MNSISANSHNSCQWRVPLVMGLLVTTAVVSVLTSLGAFLASNGVPLGGLNCLSALGNIGGGVFLCFGSLLTICCGYVYYANKQNRQHLSEPINTVSPVLQNPPPTQKPQPKNADTITNQGSKKDNPLGLLKKWSELKKKFQDLCFTADHETYYDQYDDANYQAARSSLQGKYIPDQDTAFLHHSLADNFHEKIRHIARKHNQVSTQNLKKIAKQSRPLCQNLTHEEMGHVINVSLSREWNRMHLHFMIGFYTCLFGDLIDITWKGRSTMQRVLDLTKLYEITQNAAEHDHYDYTALIDHPVLKIQWNKLLELALNDTSSSERILYLSLLQHEFPKVFELAGGSERFDKEIVENPKAFARALFLRVIDPLKYIEKNDIVISVQKTFSETPKSAKKWLRFLQKSLINHNSDHLNKFIKLFLVNCKENGTLKQLLPHIRPDMMKVLLSEKTQPLKEICSDLYAYLRAHANSKNITQLEALKFFVDLCQTLNHPLYQKIQEDFKFHFDHWFQAQVNQMLTLSGNKEFATLQNAKMVHVIAKGYDKLTPDEKRTYHTVNNMLESILAGITVNIPFYYRSAANYSDVCRMLRSDLILPKIGTFIYADGRNTITWVSTKREPRRAHCIALTRHAISAQERLSEVIFTNSTNRNIGVHGFDGIRLGLNSSTSYVSHISVPEEEMKKFKHRLQRDQFQKDGLPAINVLSHGVSDCLSKWLRHKIEEPKVEQVATVTTCDLPQECECPICLDKFAENSACVVKEKFSFKGPDALDSNKSNAIKTPCTHIFHESCLGKWIEEHRAKTRVPPCPVCRTPLMKKAAVNVNGAQEHTWLFPDARHYVRNW